MPLFKFKRDHTKAWDAIGIIVLLFAIVMGIYIVCAFGASLSPNW